MNNHRFIALHCGEETAELIEHHPNAFLLLTQIAIRAKWKDCQITGMKVGQAFIGDFKKAGLETEMEYRIAKKFLTKCKFATFEGTNKGTVATLENTRIFSVSAEQGTTKTTNQQRTNNEQGTTNHTDTQNTQSTPFALDGTSPCPSPAIAWSPEGGFSGITDRDRTEWAQAFPAVNLEVEIAKASRWLKDNPSKRKKQLGRFLSNWFSRHQERGGDIPSNRTSTQQPTDPTRPGTVINGQFIRTS